jgi:hypothetical protein
MIDKSNNEYKAKAWLIRRERRMAEELYYWETAT